MSEDKCVGMCDLRSKLFDLYDKAVADNQLQVAVNVAHIIAFMLKEEADSCK